MKHILMGLTVDGTQKREDSVNLKIGHLKFPNKYWKFKKKKKPGTKHLVPVFGIPEIRI